jgi:hypothetical protein
MNIRSAHEYTMFASAHLYRKWREQRPSNQDDLHSSVTGKVWRVYYTGVDLLLINFCTVVRVLNGTPPCVKDMGWKHRANRLFEIARR